jgi:perosamine synthetase
MARIAQGRGGRTAQIGGAAGMNADTKMNVPIARTSLLEQEVLSVLGPLRSGWLVQGPKVKEFEDKWSAFTGAKHSIAVTSCTTALHLSLAALGFGPDDEAIVPAFTWVATANVVEHLGGKVVFCDIDLNTFNLNLESLRRCITPKTKAILPVHLFGLAVDMKPLMALAKEHGLWVIEDAACGFGSTYQGQHVGTFGDTGCFSFHPRKAITYLLADHPDAGYNQRMTDLQAALGSAQMDRAQAIIAERQRLAAVYDEAFASLPWLNTPAHLNGHGHGYQAIRACSAPSR